MRFLRYAPILLPLSLLSNPVFAADQNGYTARYECRAGGPSCDVDVAALGARTCDQVVTASTPWSSINWSNNTICLQADDHTAKGVLTIPTSASGSASNYKVLRYYRSGDTNDNPWAQSQRATLKGIRIDGADYWLIHRVTINGNGSNSNSGLELTMNGGASNIIVNKILAENFQYSIIRTFDNGPNITLQNSVIRKTIVHPDYENQCIELDSTSRARVVNNEVFDCNKAISSGNGDPTLLDAKIENNDLYVSQDAHTDCAGNHQPGGPCATNEAIISFKTGGTAAEPVEIIHNRIWGARSGDGTLMGNYNWGEAPSISLSQAPEGYDANYVLVKNNIIWDAQAGISNWWGTPDHVSIIGNIIYDIQKRTQWDVFPIRLNRMENVEVYLNTIVDSPETWLKLSGDVRETDVRCNVSINSGAIMGTVSSSTQIENNAFYNTPVHATGAPELSISRQNAADAQHQNYCFYRKLQTGAEQVCIPNAKPTTSSPHLKACAANVGSRSNIGINDSLL